MGTRVVFTKQLAVASANNISLSQSPGSSALIVNGSAATGGIATIDTATASNGATGRRVILTSGGNDSGINWTVVGTNATGNTITDTFAGGNVAAAQSNLDFVTVTAIVPSGAVAGTVTAGTNGVGASPWITWNWRGYAPMNLGLAVELVSGAANFTVQHTYDDPNNLPSGVSFPLAFSSPQINAASATTDGVYSTPIVATRLLINSGTGVLRARFVQAGAG